MKNQRRFSPFYGPLADCTLWMKSDFMWDIGTILIRTTSGRPWRNLILKSTDREVLASLNSNACSYSPRIDGPLNFPFSVDVSVFGIEPPRPLEEEAVEVIVLGDCDAHPMDEARVVALMRYLDKIGDPRRKARREQDGAP